MRIAIVADVHGNLEALRAVVSELETVRPDVVVHGGDLAVNGPRPGEVLDLVRELGWPGVLGNTDQALFDSSRGPEVLKGLAAATLARIRADQVEWLRDLPLEWRSEADGVALVHAVPGDPWPVIEPETEDAVLRDAFACLGTPLAVYGHVHRGFVRDLGGLVVANTGSAGMPFDGDWRASYLLVDGGRPELRRVEYDLEAELAAHRGSGIPMEDLLARMRRHGLPPQLLPPG